MTYFTEESRNKQKLIATMLKMQNKMESSDTKFAEEMRKLNESFQQSISDIAITINVNSQLRSCFVNIDR